LSFYPFRISHRNASFKLGAERAGGGSGGILLEADGFVLKQLSLFDANSHSIKTNTSYFRFSFIGATPMSQSKILGAFHAPYHSHGDNGRA
jgi:hypothetical protein